MGAQKKKLKKNTMAELKAAALKQREQRHAIQVAEKKAKQDKLMLQALVLVAKQELGLKCKKPPNKYLCTCKLPIHADSCPRSSVRMLEAMSILKTKRKGLAQK